MKISKALWLVCLLAAGCRTPIVTDASLDVRGDTVRTDAATDRVSDAAVDAPPAPTDIVDVAPDIAPPEDVVTDVPVDTAPPVDVVIPVDAPVACALPIGGRYRDTTSSAVWYVSPDCRKHVFPNEDAYLSWYPNYDGIVTVADTALGLVARGTDITIRPGTWLVKQTTNPMTYAITRCSVLHHVTSEAIAIALYGPAWATTSVLDVDSTFPNYVRGTDITSYVYPDGTLISYPGLPDVYVMQGGQRRPLATGAFAANRFQMRFVVSTSLLYPLGSPITGYDPALADVCVP